MILAIPAAAIIPFTWIRSAPMQSGAGPAANSLSFRLTFGNLQLRPNDYSGSIELTAGQTTAITPWRFLEGDAIEGAGSWKLQVRRLRFEDQPDWRRPMMTEAIAENVVPAGVVVTAQAPQSKL